MPPSTKYDVMKFLIRASYPNYYMTRLFAREGQKPFNFDNEAPDNPLPGNKPGTVIYLDEQGEKREFPPRWYDMYRLLKLRGEKKEEYLQMLIDEAGGKAVPHLDEMRETFRQDCKDHVEQHPLFENEYLISSLSQGDFTDQQISHKGHMLLDLTRDCYPVPDFCIVTAAAFNRPDLFPELLEQAIHNLETMTATKLGDSTNPLVFAIRCAMPQYIPGLMPTLLNIGVTRNSYQAFRRVYTDAMANRVYLSTLHTIKEMLGIEKRYTTSDIELTCEHQLQRIEEMEEAIKAATPEGERLLTDAHFQALRLAQYVRQFYVSNQDLILTFMQGKQAFPSLILQRMVWTIGNEQSYPGVLYSRHSRTGKGRQIESYRNIFGEEIMTGDVTSTDSAYFDRNEIKDTFPAVYHFDPLLKKLEGRYKSPVTIEFAVETRPNQVSLFSVLQLNMSEMTGRAALLSAIDMLKGGLIADGDVVDIIKPYHLRQIVSASIDDRSLSKLQYFGKGLNVLPRTAISAVLCFSVATARQMKAKGENVCLCQERFIPEDTITLNEVDAILSMAPAAIHVVTACRGYGIPAFMDLQSYGIKMENGSIVNEEGLEIHELEHITLSSKRQTIYKGVAAFKPARFTKYLHGTAVELNDEEKVFFADMKEAYITYQKIINSQQTSYINDIDKLARLIRCDLQNQPEKARSLVNNWYSSHADTYVTQVLQSKMGSHQDQSRVFDLLSSDLKVDFFRRVERICRAKGLTGLQAGSFMIGRFVARPLPQSLWKALSPDTIAFLLNEYVLYEKYLHVLEEVGEMKLARAHSKIETEGIDNMTVSNFDLYTFAPLVFCHRNWDEIGEALNHTDHQENTHLLVSKLSQPAEKIFDLEKSWVKIRIDDLLKTE